jgi:hypothetical protein
MSRDDARIIDAALGQLSPVDRVVTLVASIITRKPEAMSGTLSMIAITAAMAGYLSLEDRIMLAEIMRDAADEVEHRREKVTIS